MGDRDCVKRLVEKTYQKMGRIPNAGWTRMRCFLNLDDGLYEDDWDRCFQISGRVICGYLMLPDRALAKSKVLSSLQHL